MNKMSRKTFWVLTWLFLYLASASLNNDVYPNTLITTTKDRQILDTNHPRPDEEEEKDLSDLRDLFMHEVEDPQICYVQGLKELIVQKDGSGIGWWARRCFAMSRRPPQINNNNKKKVLGKNAQKKLNSLLKKSKCQPIRQMIDVTNPSSKQGVTYIPCSVQVKRCIGCCSSEVLQCVPTSRRNRTFTVMKLVKGSTAKNGPSRSRYTLPQESNLMQKIKIEEHKACQCQCKESASDCSPKQEFNSNICKCVCLPSLKRKCPNGMVWSEKNCSCLCVKRKECNTGMEFNYELCSCELTNVLEFLDYNNNK